MAAATAVMPDPESVNMQSQQRRQNGQRISFHGCDLRLSAQRRSDDQIVLPGGKSLISCTFCAIGACNSEGSTIFSQHANGRAACIVARHEVVSTANRGQKKAGFFSCTRTKLLFSQ